MTTRSTTTPRIVEWIIYTQPLWPSAKATKDLEIYAQKELSLLPPPLRTSVLKFFHLKDAKLSLCSHLVKKYAISSLLNMPWHLAIPVPSADESKAGKPGFEGLEFNVSHQAGVVGFVGVVTRGYRTRTGARDGERGAGTRSGDGVGEAKTDGDNGGEGTGDGDYTVDIGIDVVSTLERRDRDRKLILDSPTGINNLISIHSEVLGHNEPSILLSPSVTWRLNLPSPSTSTSASPLSAQQQGQLGLLDQPDRHLRAFYTLWCLREAYVKMTGEALLAPWLKDLEFRVWEAPIPTGRNDFQFPPSSAPSKDADEQEQEEDEAAVLRNPEIFFKGERVDDVNIVLRSLGRGIMVCTSVRTPGRKEDALGWEVGRYQMLDIKQIVQHAEGNP